MALHNDYVYSFDMQDLPGFEEIIQESRALARVPSKKILSRVGQSLQSEKTQAIRMELQYPPLEKPFLEREAGMVFQRFATGRRSRDINAESTATKFPQEPKVVEYGTLSWANDSGHSTQLSGAVNRYFQSECMLKGDFTYIPGGFRTWHTNQYDTDGWEMYIVHTDQPGASYFKWMHPVTHTIHTLFDRNASINIFRLGHEPLFWHCIGCDAGYRWSQGFLLPDDWRSYLAPGQFKNWADVTA